MVPAHGLPLLLRKGLEVVVVPPRLKGPRVHVVSKCVDSPTGQLVLLSGVETLQQASELVGRTVLAREADLPKDYALHDVDALLGCEVEDAHHGLLGRIEEVMRGPTQDVWVVLGPYGEVLVPVVDEVVIDFRSDPVRVDLPEGLVDEEGELT